MTGLLSAFNKGGNNFQGWSKDRFNYLFSENHKISKQDIYNGSELFLTRKTEFEKKYKQKSIMIIGGGPSTQEKIKKIHQEEVDYIWTVNNFINNKDVRNLQLDLIMVMEETNLHSKEHVEFFKKNPNVLCGFEFLDKWKKYKMYYDNHFVMQTRYYGILGICQRMMVMAGLLEAKKVSFIGLDGPKFILEGKHSFEKGKNKLPSVFSFEIYEQHYKQLYKYLEKNCSNTKYENLGYGEEYHKYNSNL